MVRLIRRKFTREVKLAAIQKLVVGGSISEIARAAQVKPKDLQRWRQEFERFGHAAFSGYGNRRGRVRSETKNVIFRLTDEEYDRLKVACAKEGSRSLAEFARTQSLQPTNNAAILEFAKKVDELTVDIQSFISAFKKASSQPDRNRHVRVHSR